MASFVGQITDVKIDFTGFSSLTATRDKSGTEVRWQKVTRYTSLFLSTHRFLVKVSAPFRCYDDGGGVGLTEGHMSM